MIREIHDASQIRPLLCRDRIANLFFINDLDEMGTGSVRVYQTDGFLALNYRNDGLCVYAYDSYDMNEVTGFLKRQKFKTLMGGGDTVRPLLPYFPGSSVLERRMLVLTGDSFRPALNEEYETRFFSDRDSIIQMLRLWESRREFNFVFSGDDDAAEYAGRSHVFYAGSFSGGTLVSSAVLSAVANRSAMVTGVATRKEMENRGYAKHTLSWLAEKAFSELDLDYLALWHSTEKALAVYSSLGFRPSCEYISVTLIS